MRGPRFHINPEKSAPKAEKPLTAQPPIVVEIAKHPQPPRSDTLYTICGEGCYRKAPTCRE